MKTKECFVLQEIADEYIVVPVAEEAEKLRGVIRLNETGAFIWKLISQKDMDFDDIQKELMQQYDIDSDKAQNDLHVFIEKIKEMDCLEE